MRIREKQQDNFNNYHQARQLKPLQLGEQMYIPDNSTEGTVIEESSTHSYIVQTPGGTYRRNRRQLLALPPMTNNTEQNTQRQDASETPQSLPSDACRTRSGRISKPPDRLNL